MITIVENALKYHLDFDVNKVPFKPDVIWTFPYDDIYS